MKIADLIYEVLLEEVKDKKLLNYLTTKWYGENPTNQNRAEAEFYVEEYIKLKGGNRLGVQLQQIKTFLRRFKNFEIKNLTVPSEFSLKEMKFLIAEFVVDIPNFGNNGEKEEKDPEDFPEILQGRNLKPNKERVEASKSLWFNENRYLIINKEGFRVYQIPNQRTSINFGYYEGYITRTPVFENQPSAHMQWCTTRDQINSNLWTSYRDKGRNSVRTFYFVIDESKSPELIQDPKVAQYYLSALQKVGDVRSGFRLTSILNNGSDPEVSIDQLLNIYPQLEGEFDKFTDIPYNRSAEIEDSGDVVDRINERPGDEYEFANCSNSLKRQFIQRGKPIHEPISWEYMDDNLKKAYIDLTNSENYREKWDSEKLFKYVKSIPQDYNCLLRRFGIIGVEISEINKMYISRNYEVIFTGKKDNNVRLYRHKHELTYGIYNLHTGDWLEKDGVHYTPEFEEGPTKSKKFVKEDGKKQSILIYEFDRNNNDKFYSIQIGHSMSNDDDNVAYTYFLSNKQYMSLGDMFEERPQEFSDKDVDLGEEEEI